MIHSRAVMVGENEAIDDCDRGGEGLIVCRSRVD
jgi:hypothetical protein